MARIDVKRNGILLLFFLLALVIIISAWGGNAGLVLAAFFTPEYLTDKKGA